MQNLNQTQKKVYFDNAATSWPKPETVYLGLGKWQRENGIGAGRSHCRRAMESQSLVDRARRLAAAIFNATNPSCFIFTQNGTDSLNLVLHGLLRPGDRVVATAAEHNSVLRPLHHLQAQGVFVEVVPVDSVGLVDWEQFCTALNQPTRLVVMTHASNVTGTVQPIVAAQKLAQAKGAQILIDAAQTAGHLSLDLQACPIDYLACSGHKGLLGPLGTGLVYIAPGREQELRPLRQGGTGTLSHEESQPETLPEKFESGNLNVLGIVGLLAGLEWLHAQGPDQVHRHLAELTDRLLRGLATIPEVTIHGPSHQSTIERTAVVSLTLAGFDAAEAAIVLDEQFGIETRAGLHCAPRIHHFLGTPTGTLRLSPGPFTTFEEIDQAVEAIRQVVA